MENRKKKDQVIVLSERQSDELCRLLDVFLDFKRSVSVNSARQYVGNGYDSRLRMTQLRDALWQDC